MRNWISELNVSYSTLSTYRILWTQDTSDQHFGFEVSGYCKADGKRYKFITWEIGILYHNLLSRIARYVGKIFGSLLAVVSGAENLGGLPQA